jgi:hypothetical protein
MAIEGKDYEDLKQAVVHLELGGHGDAHEIMRFS